MPWFRLDDSFHSHPKVIAAGNEATGLYVRCGTYAAEHLTDGFIPESIALLYGSDALADTLVVTRLWRRTRGGWRMPDYLDYNPSREQVLRERKLTAERQRRHRARTIPVGNPQSPVDNYGPAQDPQVTPGSVTRDSRVSHRTPSRPVPVDPVVEVVNRANGSNPRASPAVIDSIIEEVHNVTGRHITEEWARKVASLLLDGRSAANPAAYARQAIRNDPNPQQRFLPLY